MGFGGWARNHIIYLLPEPRFPGAVFGFGVWVRFGFPACWFWVSRIWVLLPGFLYGLAKLYGLGFVELYVRGLESQLTDNCGGGVWTLGFDISGGDGEGVSVPPSAHSKETHSCSARQCLVSAQQVYGSPPPPCLSSVLACS